MMKKIAFIPLILMFSCANNMKIIDTPISFSENRIELTKQYIREHYGHLRIKSFDEIRVVRTISQARNLRFYEAVMNSENDAT